MLRLVWVIGISAPFVIFYYLWTNHVAIHKKHYSVNYRYRMVQRMIRIMNHNGFIGTVCYGLENLPESGGYVMYPNHQGKYDVLGIIVSHPSECSFVIDEGRSHIPFANEITKVLDGVRLDKTDARAQVSAIFQVADQVREGRRFIIFPEGGYDSPENKVEPFLPGAFKCSVRSRTPIVPVAIIDSGKVFGINSLRRIKTQVHFLEPISYEEYKDKKTREIADIVRARIEKVIAQYAS